MFCQFVYGMAYPLSVERQFRGVWIAHSMVSGMVILQSVDSVFCGMMNKPVLKLQFPNRSNGLSAALLFLGNT